MSNYIYVLQVDNSPDVRAFVDAEVAMHAYIDHISERISNDFDNESLEMNAKHGGYNAYWDGEFIAKLDHVLIEHE